MKTPRIPFLLLCLIIPSSAFTRTSQAIGQTRPRGRLAHLKTYAGEIPVDYAKRPHQNLLGLPELKAPLLKLLGANGYHRLVDDFEVQSPIEILSSELKGGRATIFWVASAFNKRSGENVILIIDLDDPSALAPIYVGFWPTRTSSPEWHSTQGDYRQLPDQIRGRLEKP
jgi:hypothetical protein